MRAIPSTDFRPASYPVRAPARMDPLRILGYSSAIAINTIAAGLLLMPLQAPPPAPAPEPRAVWVLPATPRPPVLPPPRDQPRPEVPTPQVAPVAIAPVPVVAPVVVDHGTLPVALPVDPAPLASLEPAPALSGPAPMTLEYAVAPPPPYPRDALRNGDEGLVMLQVLVDVDGRPLEVEIAEGSGHRELDQAARRHVLAHWRFRPAMRDGQAVQAIGLVPIDFALD